MIWLASRLGALVYRVRSRINHPWIWVYEWHEKKWKVVSACPPSL